MSKKVFYLEKIFKMRYSMCLYLMKQKSNSNFRKKNENAENFFIEKLMILVNLFVSVNHLYWPIFTRNQRSNLKWGKS